MTQDLAAGIAMGVAAAVFIISIICSVKLTNLSWRVRFKERAKASGCVTTGYFVKRHQRYRVNESNSIETYHYVVTIKYKYTVNQTEYYTKVKYSHSSGHRGDYFSDPMQIKVYYDENDPNKAYAESELSDKAVRQNGVILTLIATIVMGIGTYFLLNALFI